MNGFRKAELVLSRLGLISIVLIILIGGISRSIGYPVIWSLEIAMVLFAWVSMFAIDYAFQTRRHIGIDALTNLFSKKLQTFCLWFNEVFILGFLLCGVWYGFSFTWTTHNQVLPVTEISIAWLNSAVPTGCLLMVVTSLSFILQGCRQKIIIAQEETC
ncbi:MULTISPECIES: TRAP transporter small permease subunit [unclassified Escherichia]|uniref:TRAP transporter small permease n=1 Tax=unclassified Escherichia TaxID=2608889 RepID=UPI0010371E08|nr:MULTISPECIES: TRAP transporter small permease subunit [unclassified Escherichia]TBR66824.1 TRAP transporter small permease subunit [Escherichia sp. E10V4]TLI73870.1 TRAP transporter small permease subunit [Escherichia sp. E2586]